MMFLKLSFVLALLPWLSVFAIEGSGETAQPESYFGSYLDQVGRLYSDPSAAQLDSFHVVINDSVVGRTSVYALHFELPGQTFFSLGYGGFAFSFPDCFDLSPIRVVELIDDCPTLSYGVRSYDIIEGYLTLFLTNRIHKRDQPPDSPLICQPVHLVVLLEAVKNPVQAGNYHLAGLAFDRHKTIVAGPNLSDEFAIIPGPLYAIEVSPAHDITLMAGDIIKFYAVGLDQFSNEITGLGFDWFLAKGSDSIGEFTGSVFQALTVGQGSVVAMANGVMGQSEQITVLPGELVEMDMTILPDQVVGQPLLELAQIALYDGYGNPKTDYYLQGRPISLVSNNGSLAPDVIDDQELLNEGIVSLLPAQIIYSGPTGTVEIYATNGEVTSPTVEVSFNGYDILAVLGGDGLPLSQVYAGAENVVSVVVQNNGQLRASFAPVVRARFGSGGDSTEVAFEPGSNGTVDTVTLDLPAAPQSISEDTLVIEVIAEYEVGGQLYATGDRRELPIEILAPYSFEIVEGSFKPDTAYPGEPFEMSFNVAVDGFSGPINRTDLVVSLTKSRGRTSVIYGGSPDYCSFENDVIRYSGLPALVQPHQSLLPGWHSVKMQYSLVSNGVRFELTTPFADSVYLLPELQVSYVSNSLKPTMVFAGAEIGFRFDVNLGNDYPLAVSLDDASFAVKGSGFSVSTNLIVSGDSLYPGLNSVETEVMFIPLSQMGESLHVSASLPLMIPGVGGIVTFATDFESQSVFVDELSVARIVSVDAVAPNKPKVNTGQLFQINCQVANLSNSALGPLELGLSSDGNSVFDSTLTIQSINARDTIEVCFDVTASPEPISTEEFQVDILSTDVAQEPPLDNDAYVMIQRPAELELTYSLQDVVNGLVDRGGSFGLSVRLRNLGEAATSEGTFSLSTGGVDFGAEDPITGAIAVDQHQTFLFRAPLHDTVATFVFSLVDLPVDSNTNAPALIRDASFEFTLQVESLEADLLVELQLLGSNLILPGREKELFRLNLTNRGASSVSGIRLDEIDIAFIQADNADLDVGLILDPLVSGFYENGLPVSQASLSGNKLLLLFDDFIVLPAETLSIVFTAKFKETVPPSFRLGLERRDISAVFAEGPNAGQPVEISSTVTGEYLISQMYATKGKQLQESFVIEDNPFNPEVSYARFSYELDQPSAVEFRVFTLTGEEVYTRNLPEGSNGAVTGENEILWDGRNNAGHMVINGVYIASVKIIRTGEWARMKVAVVK